MTYAKIVPVKRGLSAKRAHANSSSMMLMFIMERACVWAEVMCMRACSAAHPLSLASTDAVTRLIVGLYMRESNQPRPGVAPGDPQHKAVGWTSSSGAERVCAAMQRVAQVFLYGNAKTPPK